MTLKNRFLQVALYFLIGCELVSVVLLIVRDWNLSHNPLGSDVMVPAIRAKRLIFDFFVFIFISYGAYFAVSGKSAQLRLFFAAFGIYKFILVLVAMSFLIGSAGTGYAARAPELAIKLIWHLLGLVAAFYIFIGSAKQAHVILVVRD